jgi:ribosome-associated heat shock protein Hsp15
LTARSAAAKLLSMSDEGAVRLDVWLDVACLFKTRSQAQQACKRGRVEVNGHRGKPHRSVRPGDEIRISLPGGARRILEIVDIESTHVPRSRARELYVDHTPPPSREELELRRLQRLSSPPRRARGMGAPKKGERRRLRRIKEGWEE